METTGKAGIIYHIRGNAWRGKGDYDRSVADTIEVIRLANAKAPGSMMTPPGSV